MLARRQSGRPMTTRIAHQMSIHPIHPVRTLERPLALGFLCPHNPHDRRAFSGTAYFAAKALGRRSGIDLHILGHKPLGPMARVLRRHGPPLDPEAIDPAGLDGVVGLVATELLNKMLDNHANCPVLHMTDATPAFLREAYGWNVPGAADTAEHSLVRRAARTVFSSPEIAARAARDLDAPDLVPEVAHFGVNFDHPPQVCPKKTSLNRLNLLFVGLDWERKGGDIAVAALDQLRAMDIDAQLTIVGRCPERHRDHPAITVAGYLNKNRSRDADRLACLFMQAHLLLLPSRADCTPMVVAEAMAHGTPVIASETGGIGSLITPGTGTVLPAFASPADWAQSIVETTLSPEAYAMMSDAAFDRASQLSWDNWAERIETLARQAIQFPVVAERGLKAAVSA